MRYPITKLLIIGTMFMVGCGPSAEEQKIAQEERTLDSLMTISALKAPEVSVEVMQDIMKSIPSPLEIASLIKESGAPYSTEMLNNPDNAENYNSIYTKAINLGIYGTDMGYINLYDKPSEIFGYLGSIRGLADDLKVGHFFDFQTLKRLSSKRSNMDSLLYISTSGFQKMDAYLSENKRGNISSLILMGGWLESLHIATEVASNGTVNDNSPLVERIGEQKIVLDEILFLLSIYDNDPKTKEIKEQLIPLKDLFSKVKIVYVEAEPETKEVDGMLVIVDNSTSTVELDDKLLEEIRVQVNSIRKDLTK